MPCEPAVCHANLKINYGLNHSDFSLTPSRRTADKKSGAHNAKPRAVRGFGHAHVAMSKLVQVILAAQKRLFN